MVVATLRTRSALQAAYHGFRSFSATSLAQDALKFCVVGSGPAGFYTLLKRFDGAEVDILEALPTPFGLVRSGVAPDHQDTKNVINQFSDIARNPRVEFFGNVTVGGPQKPGAALTLGELRSMYNAVVLAYGAESDRKLGIPGENLPGVYPAREFVQWYNGHPHAAKLRVPDFSKVESVAICGLGNVALDIARVLLQPVERLAATDAAVHAVDALRHSAVREVHMLGRRGPAQAAFTPKELRELLGMEGIRVEIHPEGCLNLDPACEAEIKGNRIKRRVVEVLNKAAVQGNKPGDRALHLHFLRSPVEILESNGNVAGVRLEITRLESSSGGGSQRAVGTGQIEDLPAQLVLESIGYKSVPMEGAPFEPRAGIIPNQLGQVVTPGTDDGKAGDGGAHEAGLFVCGWLKRGPSGIIGTNLVDAEQTVDTMVQLQDTFPKVKGEKSGRAALKELLAQREVPVVSFEDWEKVDAEEVKRGAAAGKPREKIVDVQEMVKIARNGAS